MNVNTKKYGNIKHFDFSKKPIKPTFLMWLAKRIISFPDLKKRGAVIKKINTQDIENKPYLLLVTHSSMVDFNLMLKATHPHPCVNVMTLEGFNTYSYPLMHGLGVIGKRKFISDVNLIRNIRYTLNELKCPFVIFPEARYSLNGCGSYIPKSLSSLVKSLGVPLVILRIHGNFITCPQWNKINKGTYVEAEFEQVLTPEKIKLMTKDEIYSVIKQNFTYDDYKWQYDNKIRIDHPDRAKGLHALLYKCPSCLSEGETYSEGITLTCRHCGKSWVQNELGRLKAKDGTTEFEHIPDWTDWERECVRKEIRDGTYFFEDDVNIETLPGWKKFYKLGHGKLIQTPGGTKIICDDYYGNGEKIIFKQPLELDSLHIEYDYLGGGDCVDISVPDDSFWCYLSKRDAITKLSFATEEIYALALDAKEKERNTIG